MTSRRKNPFTSQPSIILALNNATQENPIAGKESIDSHLKRGNNVLDKVSMKYRYELHEMEKITEDAGIGKKKKDNLFRRVSIIGTLIDPDIKYGMHLLQERKLHPTIERKESEGKITGNAVPDFNYDLYTYKPNVETYNLAPRGNDGMFDISELSSSSSENSEKFQECFDDEEKKKLKKVDLKIPIHKRRFSVYTKGMNNLLIDESKESEILRNKRESLEKRKKQLGRVKKTQRRSYIQLKESEGIQLIKIPEFHLEEKIEEYDRIKIGSDGFELIKNYLTTPKKEKNRKATKLYSESENDNMLSNENSPRSKIMMANVKPSLTYEDEIRNTPADLNSFASENIKNGIIKNDKNFREIPNFNNIYTNKKNTISLTTSNAKKIVSSYHEPSKSSNFAQKITLNGLLLGEEGEVVTTEGRGISEKENKGFNLALIKSNNGENNYTMVRKNNNSKARRCAIKPFDIKAKNKIDKVFGKLPDITNYQRLAEFERKEIEKIRFLNNKKVQTFISEKRKKFGIEVDVNKTKLKSVGEKINKILFDALKIYDKIDKKVKKNIERKYNSTALIL